MQEIVVDGREKLKKDMQEIERKEEFEELKPTVLWLSRHRPLNAQLDELNRKLGEYRMFIHERPLSTADEAIKLAEKHNADYIVPVLPLSFVIRLLDAARGRYTVLKADMQLIHNCPGMPCSQYDRYRDTIIPTKDYENDRTIFRHFRFRRFLKLVEIREITEEF